jgi:hypothetical protein
MCAESPQPASISVDYHTLLRGDVTAFHNSRPP